MRLITLLFTLLFWFNAVAVAPYGIKGQSQSGTLYSNVHQFPNNQVTNMGGINALVETGNKNILVNPSFEHSTFSTGWTSGAGSFSQNLTVEIDGLKAAEVTLSAQALAITQDSTLYAAQFADGVQGLASIRVKTSLSGIKVCSRQAGVTSTTNCVNVQGNGKWGLYKVPMILGATSNGISIASTGLVSGTIYIDDAFVGGASLTQEMNACNSPSCETEFSAKIGSTGTVTEENIDWINSNASNPSTGNYTITFNTNLFTVAPNCTATVWQPSGTRDRLLTITSISSTQVLIQTSVGNGSAESKPFTIACQKQGADFTAAKQLSNGNTYSSTNADTDWASCIPTSSQGFGSPIMTFECKRQGGDLLMKGRVVSGVPTAAEARIGLPLWNGSQLISAGSTIIPSLQLAGKGNISVIGGSFFGGLTVLIEPSVAYFTIGSESAATPGINKNTGNGFSTNGATMFFNARIPIEGWQQSNIIIGQFNGLESCTNTLECTDTFSAKISEAGVVVSGSENVDWINGNCSLSGSQFTCNFNSGIFTASPNCTITSASAINNGPIAGILSQSSSSIVYQTVRHDAVNVAYFSNIICQKQGADYIGKTAKAVASDQNVRTPGQTNVVHFAVSYGTTGTPCTASPCSFDSVGSQVSSVTRTTVGTYSVNFVSPLSKVQCAYGTGYGSAGDSVVPYAITSCSSSCSAISFNTRQTNSIATLKDSFGNLLCTGIP
jgi:hypothetical protein